MDTFCFEEDTRIHVYGRGLVPIHTIQLGERLGKYRNGPIVTSTYRFMADGQPMIRFEPTEAYPYPILVSSNHYMYHNYKWIRADEHPDGHKAPDWAGGDKKFLYCLDTNTHEIPIGPYIFLDYDETDDSDDMTMKWIEKCVNGKSSQTKKYPWRYQPCCDPDTLVQMKNGDSKPLHAIRIGDRLTTGLVTGIVTRNVYEYVTTMRGTRMTPSTLIWTNHTWERAGIMNSDVQTVDQPIEMVQLVVMHASMFETTTGDIIRDFVEIHHPEAELETTKALSDKKTKNTS
jgi:hypothetical protein